jgi:hypothetical protein
VIAVFEFYVHTFSALQKETAQAIRAIVVPEFSMSFNVLIIKDKTGNGPREAARGCPILGGSVEHWACF